MVMLSVALLTALLAVVHSQRIELWTGVTGGTGRLSCAGDETTANFAGVETCFEQSISCWFSVDDGPASILAYKQPGCKGPSRQIFATLNGNKATSDFINYKSYHWTTPGVNDKRDEGEGNNTLVARQATTLNNHPYTGSQTWVVESFTVNLIGTQIIVGAGITALVTKIRSQFANGFTPKVRHVASIPFAGNTYQLVVDNVKTSVDSQSVVSILQDGAAIAAQSGQNSFGLAIDNTSKAVEATVTFTII